jgi:hypothetical protein
VWRNLSEFIEYLRVPGLPDYTKVVFKINLSEFGIEKVLSKIRNTHMGTWL